jgi:hypothetical protein
MEADALHHTYYRATEYGLIIRGAFLEYQFEWFHTREGRRACAPLYDFILSDIIH